MRVLNIIQRSQLRGAEIFACQLSLELQKLGHAADVLILFGGPPAVLPFPLNFYHLNAVERKQWYDFKAYKRLADFIKNGKYDIVQANAGDTLKYSALSKTFFGWKAKLVFRNANKMSDFINSIPKKIIYKRLTAKLDYVASVSELCNSDFRNTFRFPAAKVATLPIGVNLPKQTEFASLETAGIAGDGPFILHVGGFVSEKNHKGLLRIFSSVLKNFPAAKLLLAGEGKLMAETKSLAAQLKLEKAVMFLGRRTDIPLLMHRANLLVLPSLIEGLPGVILEAFAAKLPVVAYNVGGISEVVFNNQTGYLIDKGNEAGFADAVSKILHQKPVAVTEAALELVVSKYSIRKVAANFLHAYQKLLT